MQEEILGRLDDSLPISPVGEWVITEVDEGRRKGRRIQDLGGGGKVKRDHLDLS